MREILWNGHKDWVVSDFSDFNYRNVAFDISGVDKQKLKEALEKDNINHLSRLDNANYIAIWNSDLQDFKTLADIYFDSDNKWYVLSRLMYVDGKWFHKYVEARLSEIMR